MLDDNTIMVLMDKFIIGILIFIRISGMFIAGPFFKNESISPQVKAILALILSVSITSAFWQEQPQMDFHLWNLVGLAFKEILTGAAIGFSANMVFFAARFAGGVIDFGMGYQAGAMFSIDNDSPTLVGEFQSFIVLMIFLFINGHHFLIEAVYASLRAVPLDTFQVSETTITLLVKLATSVMIIGVKLAAPLIVALFLTNLALALLARVAPQTNIFILSFQLKVVVGLLVLAGSVALFAMVSKYGLEIMQTETLKILMSLNPARV